MKALLLSMLIALGCASAWAGEPATPEHWQTPPGWSAQTRTRYQHLLETLRCLVCQDESLASSDAPLAADLRRHIRRMINRGESDRQIRQYLVDRYGDFVLYDPPFMPLTWVLWIGPFVLLAVGLGVVVIQARRSGEQEDDDAASLRAGHRLLDEGKRRRP